MIEQKHLDEAEKHQTLGPHYFSAREAAEKFMDDFKAEEYEPILKKATDDFYSALHDRLETFLLSDVESNLHNHMWRQIDSSVKALMSGEKWALERYALIDKYGDGQKIREVVAKHIPKELQDARVVDLEQEVERLKKDVVFYRR